MIAHRAALAVLAVLAVATAGVATAGVAAARAVRFAGPDWSQPVRLAGPFAVDVLPAEISFSPTGEAAVGFVLEDADDPVLANPFVLVRPPRGRPGPPRPVAGAQAILDLGFAGPLTLLTGATPAGETCCTDAQAMDAQRGGFGGRRTLVSGLTGATTGELVALGGQRALAAVATGRGVWVSQSDGAGRFPPARRLTLAGDRPVALAATGLAGDASIVAWATQSTPRTIFSATGSRLRGPRGRRAAVVVPSGHQVDELAVGRGSGPPTVAWIESWLDRSGGYHSQPVVEDLSAAPRPHPFPVGAQAASGLSFAADAGGDQVIAWEQCTTAGTCSAIAAQRRAGGRFGVPQYLGAVDPSQPPVATISPGGQALVGWIRLGQVVVAAGSPAPSSPAVSSSSSSAPASSAPACGSAPRGPSRTPRRDRIWRSPSVRPERRWPSGPRARPRRRSKRRSCALSASGASYPRPVELYHTPVQASGRKLMLFFLCGAEHQG